MAEMDPKPKKLGDNKRLMRVIGSAPWLKVRTETQEFRTRTFKSGNSLALRLPAALNLQPGIEMALRVEDDDSYSFEPVERPKRKFNIAKVAGSATSLRLIKDEDRVFEERPLLWDDAREQQQDK